MAALIKIDHSFTTRAARADVIRFCSRCGEPAEDPPREDGNEEPLARVCATCGMGMLLSCARDALPGARAAFLIATVELQVNAVSLGAEEVFGSERDLLGLYLLDLMTSPMGDPQFGKTVGQAALRARDPVVMPVRGRSRTAEEAGMLAARISTCGPPRAALVTVEPSGFGRPR